MNNERSLTIQVRRELVRLSTESSPVGRRAATELMELPREEVRLALGETLRNPVVLCPIIENSMALDGGGGSSLLAALEPDEIKAMTGVSRQIFADEFIFMDTENGVYDIVSEKFVRQIFTAGNKNQEDRLKFLGNPATTSTDKILQGPWAILRDEVAIRPEAVLDYLLSIQEADRLTSWKIEAVKALGLDLVVYAAKLGMEKILTACREIDEELYTTVINFFQTGDLSLIKANLIDSHLEQMEEITAIPSVTEEDMEGLKRTDIDLDAAVANLLTAEASEFKSETFGTLDADEIEDVKTADGTFQRLLKKGDSEEK